MRGFYKTKGKRNYTKHCAITDKVVYQKGVSKQF